MKQISKTNIYGTAFAVIIITVAAVVSQSLLVIGFAFGFSTLMILSLKLDEE